MQTIVKIGILPTAEGTYLEVQWDVGVNFDVCTYHLVLIVPDGGRALHDRVKEGKLVPIRW